jgi:quinol monooxygenase YgiN
MIVITARLPAKPGRFEDGKKAAKALREASLGKPGMVVYEFFADEEGQAMIVTEAYVDCQSLLNHAATADFGPLLDGLQVESITFHGEATPEAVALVTHYAPATFYPPL